MRAIYLGCSRAPGTVVGGDMRDENERLCPMFLQQIAHQRGVLAETDVSRR